MKIGVVLCLTLCVTLSLVDFSSATDYCSPALCGGSNHIACNNNGALAGTCAADAQVLTLTASMKQALVNKHNEYRNIIAAGGFSGFAPAVRMATMVWDDELAQIASLNVRQCAMSHDACRNTDKFKYSGQNLGYMGWYGTDIPVQDVLIRNVEMWYNEYKDCTMSEINSYSNPSSGAVIGHFTQVVQDKANAVGCATLKQTKNNIIEQYTACNYARTNFMSRPVYTAGGGAASKCTTGVNPSYKALCSLAENINANEI